MADRIVNSEFRCPKCGGFRWGTSNCTEPFSKWIGHCHNFACRFTWKRSTDDWRHFIFTVRPTRAEYQRFERLRVHEANRRNRRRAEPSSTETKR
jgi:hypothetical protein